MAERREKRSTGRGSKSSSSKRSSASEAKSTGSKRRTGSRSKTTASKSSTGSKSKSTTSRRTTRSQSKSTAPKRSTRSKPKAESKTKPKSKTKPESKPKTSERERSTASESEERIRGTAPSAADITKLDKFEPSEEAKRHKPSDVDAMGHDKRREVVGQGYGPSRRSQIIFFVAVAAVLVVVVGGWLTLVNAFDKPPGDDFPQTAPWSTTPGNQELAAEQNAQPVSPLTPCGEPGNEYPIPDQSPCAPPNESNDFQGSGSSTGHQGGGTESSTGQ